MENGVTNMDEQEVNCSVCLEPFDEDTHSPRTLRCGHTLCTFCIEALLQRVIADRNCPECRKPLKITNVFHLPVSYTVLRLSRTLSDINFKLVNELKEDGEVCLEHGSPIIMWCKDCCKAMCRRCKCNGCSSVMPLAEALLHLKRERVDKTNTMINSLYRKKEFYETMRVSLEDEIAQLKKKLDNVVENLNKIEAAIVTVEEDEAKVVEINSIRRIERAIRQSEQHMEEFQAFLDENSLTSTPEISLSSPINFQDLKERVRISQSMYAVHEKVDGSMRWSELSIQGKQLLVHAAEETPPPTNAALIKFETIMETVSPHNQQAFLDINIDNRYEGRVYTLMYGYTPRGENFLLFCRGDCGPCYKGQQLVNGNTPSNFVQIQTFENTDDCKALVEGITDGVGYTRKVHPGIICGNYCTEDNLAYFEIATRHGSRCPDNTSFGKVTNGLAILRNAFLESKSTNKRVTISDCGIIVPL